MRWGSAKVRRCSTMTRLPGARNGAEPGKARRRRSLVGRRAEPLRLFRMRLRYFPAMTRMNAVISGRILVFSQEGRAGKLIHREGEGEYREERDSQGS